MSVVMDVKKPSTNILRALRRAVGLPDREAVLRERDRVHAEHLAAGRARQTALAAARAEVEAWRAPELRVNRLELENRLAAAAESRRADQLAAELRANPPRACLELRDFVEAVYRTVNADSDAFRAGLRKLGEALCRATIFVRDTGWTLDDQVARETCDGLRHEIQAAFDEARRPRDDEEGEA